MYDFQKFNQDYLGFFNLYAKGYQESIKLQQDLFKASSEMLKKGFEQISAAKDFSTVYVTSCNTSTALNEQFVKTSKAYLDHAKSFNEDLTKTVQTVGESYSAAVS